MLDVSHHLLYVDITFLLLATHLVKDDPERVHVSSVVELEIFGLALELWWLVALVVTMFTGLLQGALHNCRILEGANFEAHSFVEVIFPYGVGCLYVDVFGAQILANNVFKVHEVDAEGNLDEDFEDLDLIHFRSFSDILREVALIAIFVNADNLVLQGSEVLHFDDKRVIEALGNHK